MQAAQLDRQLRPIYGEHPMIHLLLIISSRRVRLALSRCHRFRIEQNRDLNVQ